MACSFCSKGSLRGRTLIGGALLLAAGLSACGRSSNEMPGFEEAVELWTHPDTLGIDVYAPMDLKLASRDVAWGLDQRWKLVMRFEPREGEFGVFGFLDRPPVEVVEPVRLAVSENQGIFVYDDSTDLVGLFTPDGQHVRSFDPGFRPAIFEASRQPLRLTFGIPAADADGIPHLTVIQTDFRGLNADTLLGPDHGPEVLREVAAVEGNLIASPSAGGLWLYSRELPDTVFELSANGTGRRLVLPEADPRRVGILADLEQEILWVVAPRPPGGLLYEAYDISVGAPDGVIDGATTYLGVRTTPFDYRPKVAYDGVVGGWHRLPRGAFVPRAYDMLVEDLRTGAEDARRGRTAWRDTIDAEWERLGAEWERLGAEAEAAEAAGTEVEVETSGTEENVTPGGAIPID